MTLAALSSARVYMWKALCYLHFSVCVWKLFVALMFACACNWKSFWLPSFLRVCLRKLFATLIFACARMRKSCVLPSFYVCVCESSLLPSCLIVRICVERSLCLHLCVSVEAHSCVHFYVCVCSKSVCWLHFCVCVCVCVGSYLRHIFLSLCMCMRKSFVALIIVCVYGWAVPYINFSIVYQIKTTTCIAILR